MPLLAPIPHDCALEHALEARDLVARDVARGVGASPPPPVGDKVWYGTPVGDTWQTSNFGVVWNPGEASQDVAEVAADALETAWDALVVADGWAPPPGSEAYLVWVVLDPYMGADGLTVELEAPDLPMGHVVLHLNPTLASDEARFQAVAVHEFAHALQYRVRDWDAAGSELWFWEATAAWAVPRVLPADVGWVTEATGFTAAPGLPYDSVEDGHDRGMSLLLRWLEAQQPGATLAAWTEGRDRPGDDWAAILAASTGLGDAELWAGFAAAAGNDGLPGSASIPDVATRGELVSGSYGDDLPRLAVDYHRLGGRAPMLAWLSDGTGEEAVLAVPGSVGPEVLVAPGQRLAVVGLDPFGADYQVFLSPVADEPVEPPPGGGTLSDPYEVVTPSSCGCAAGASGTGGWLGWLVVATAATTRRGVTARAASRPCCTRSR